MAMGRLKEVELDGTWLGRFRPFRPARPTLAGGPIGSRTASASMFAEEQQNNAIMESLDRPDSHGYTLSLFLSAKECYKRHRMIASSRSGYLVGGTLSYPDR
ncbi:hypothetical protein VTN96DRAFT_8473 [Rasamsonia emersonii]